MRLGTMYSLTRFSRTLTNVSSEIWTQRHWQRTSALQCCHNQPAVDKMIPIYFKPKDGSAAPGRVSQIFISDKAQSDKLNKSKLRDISRVDSTIRCASSDPYVAILVDLGRSYHEEFEASWEKVDTNDAYSLRIYAAGINAATFPFLTPHPYIVETLRHIVSPPKLPAQEGLRDKVKFGSTRTKSHLFWEIGNEKEESTHEDLDMGGEKNVSEEEVMDEEMDIEVGTNANEEADTDEEADTNEVMDDRD